MSATPVLNMDRERRVVIHTLDQPWQAAPAQGVWRKPLEREAAESGQVTSIVRYEPGSAFRAHHHPRGEEILVLEGVFADDHGEYPQGSYLRNPPGSAHAPASPQGCVLLVKLNMFSADDRSRIVINTGTQDWLPGLVDGLSVMPLHQFADQHTALVKWAPNTRFHAHSHPHGEEIFVLDGIFEDDQGRYPQGTWLRNPAGSQHTPFSTTGCSLLVKTGHLEH